MVFINSYIVIVVWILLQVSVAVLLVQSLIYAEFSALAQALGVCVYQPEFICYW